MSLKKYFGRKSVDYFVTIRYFSKKSPMIEKKMSGGVLTPSAPS